MQAGRENSMAQVWKESVRHVDVEKESMHMIEGHIVEELVHGQAKDEYCTGGNENKKMGGNLTAIFQNHSRQ